MLYHNMEHDACFNCKAPCLGNMSIIIIAGNLPAFWLYPSYLSRGLKITYPIVYQPTL